MASAQALGGSSRAGRVLGPGLDKIIKNAAWRKHSNLVAACKAALDHLDAVTDSDDSPASPLLGLSTSDADTVLDPLALAIDAASSKVAEPALDCAQKLFSLGLIRGEIDHRSEGDDRRLHAASRLVGSICRCGGLGEDAIELAMLRVLIAAVRSPVVLIRGECLAQIVKSCYNVYLGSQNGANQLCAKLVLAQILAIMYARVEVDAMEVGVRTVSIADMLDLSDRNLNDTSLVKAVQNHINGASESEVLPPDVQKGEGT